MDRLEGLLVLEGSMSALTEAGMHMLAGEYVANMAPEDAHAAAQDFVDAMEFTGLSGSDFDPRERVGLLRVVQASRKQAKAKVGDMAREKATVPPNRTRRGLGRRLSLLSGINLAGMALCILARSGRNRVK